MTSSSLPLVQRSLGRCGITVPALGIGCWAIGGPADNLGLPMGWSTGGCESAAIAGLETAWSLGARLFDTADVYGLGRSERLLGRLAAQVPRRDIVLVSKVGYLTDDAAEHAFAPDHMRRRLEQTLTHLGTDHLDIYFLHNANFGPDDRWLEPAAEAMRAFQREGLITAIGMRGPHRFARDRIDAAPSRRGDKITRFQEVFAAVEPQVLAVRDNLLSPPGRAEGIFAFAERHRVGVLINKPLGQGLLTGAYDAAALRAFGPGDHRARKAWFTDPGALTLIADGLQELHALVGPHRQDVIRIALWACLERYAHAAVLVGFTTAEQVRQNLTALGEPPHPDVIAQARAIMGRVQEKLDARGEVFTDEKTGAAR
ncbi:aldo/keto reductase [Streptosporangium sp. NPDC048047]|uniref:aldo/keto reductase n=1 Tax=Streptosporangium sp. NPDC048047 TaxID=3155748 RepID=UPI00343C5921